MSNQPNPWGNFQMGPNPGGQNPYSAPSFSGPSYSPPPQPGVEGKAIAALIIGVVGLVAWCCPLIGFPLNIVGIVLGTQAMKSPNSASKIMSIVGLVLCAISLVLTLGNAVAGVIIQMNNPQNPLFR